MGSALRKLKRHGCPNAKARAHATERIEIDLVMRGRELTKAGRAHVLDRMAAEQAGRIHACRHIWKRGSRWYLRVCDLCGIEQNQQELALMSEQSREPEASMGGDAGDK